jgi:hypothetical protein
MCLLLSLVLAARAGAWVGIDSAPAEEKLSSDFRVRVLEHDVPVYCAPCDKVPLGNNYSFASFCTDKPVDVEVTTSLPLDELKILPASAGVRPKITRTGCTITVNPGQKLSIEPTGRAHPLLLFVDPKPPDEPKQPDPKLRYFPAGIHRPEGGLIELHSGETLYLAPGAIVHAAVEAKAAEHIRIAGRGILDGGDWAWAKGPTPQMVRFENCREVQIDDVTVRASFIWTIATWNSSDVRVNNVKIVGDRLPNDDGFDLCNTQRVKIHDCFVRTDDDCIAIKGMNDKHNGPTSDIDVSECLFWCDRARIVLMGHESQATEMSNIRIHNCEILHYTEVPFLLEPGEEMPLKGVRIENIHINADGRGEITRLRPTVNKYMKEKVPGRIDDVEFRNMVVDNASGVGIRLIGADALHMVQNVTFTNLRVNGKIVTQDQIDVGAFTKNVQVGSSEQ